MGLFSRHKSDDDKVTQVSKDNSLQKGDTSQPPSLDMKQASTGISSSSKLTPPPMPGGGSLDDIKRQVSPADDMSDSEFELPTQSQMNKMMTPSISPDMDEHSDPLMADDTDSLFDMPDLGVSSSSRMPSPSMPKSNYGDSTVDTNAKRGGHLNFISENFGPRNQSYFVTTKQFRTMLEIIESVKSRVKESSETYLRLMDIKSEEDIEYENLRKDFQFIEDKLYELDSIIFEK